MEHLSSSHRGAARTRLARRIPSSHRTRLGNMDILGAINQQEVFREWAIDQMMTSTFRTRQQLENFFDSTLSDKLRVEPDMDVKLWWRVVLVSSLMEDDGLEWESAQDLIDYSLEQEFNAAERALRDLAEEEASNYRQQREGPVPYPQEWEVPRQQYQQSRRSQRHPQHVDPYSQSTPSGQSNGPTPRYGTARCQFRSDAEFYRAWIGDISQEQGVSEVQFALENRSGPGDDLTQYWRWNLSAFLQQRNTVSPQVAERLINQVLSETGGQGHASQSHRQERPQSPLSRGSRGARFRGFDPM